MLDLVWGRIAEAEEGYAFRGVMAGEEKELDDPVWIPRLGKALVEDPVLKGERREEYLHWAKAFFWFCRETGWDPKMVGGRDDFAVELGNIGRSKEHVGRARVAVAKLQRIMEEFDREGGGKSVDSGNGLDVADDSKGKRAAPSDWDEVRKRLEAAIGIRHYSRKTLKTYAHWINGFSKFLKLKEPSWIEGRDAHEYLTYLAMDRKIAATTQNQAFNALLFLFERVLEIELTGLEETPRAKKGMNVPEVLSREEVHLLLDQLEYPYDIFFTLSYGCGLRLGEALALRIQDVDMGLGTLVVHRGKGGKSRKLPLPVRILPKLKGHLLLVRDLFEEDRKMKTGGVFLPESLERKMPGAPKEWPWYWVFPAKEPTWVKEEGRHRRYHLHESLVQKNLKETVDRSGLSKRVSAHTFRHSYATHLIMMGMDIRTLQELMGHSDVKTTQIYTQAVRQLSKGPMSPLDAMP